MPNTFTIEIKSGHLALCCNGEPVPPMRRAEPTQEPSLPGVLCIEFYVGGAITLGPAVNTQYKEASE